MKDGNYTIEKMIYKLIVNKKELQGYAFLDLSSHCVIIVYGENNRDYLIDFWKKLK
jgi:hypothetical protein